MRRGYMGKPTKGTFKRLLKLVLSQHLFKIIIVVLLMGASTFSNVYAMSSIQNVLTAAIEIKDDVQYKTGSLEVKSTITNEVIETNEIVWIESSEELVEEWTVVFFYKTDEEMAIVLTKENDVFTTKYQDVDLESNIVDFDEGIFSVLEGISGDFSYQLVLSEISVVANYSSVYRLVILMAIFYVLSMILTYTHLRIMINVGQDSLLHIRTNLFDHMMGLPLSYFDSNQHGDLMSRYTNDVDATRQMISQSLPQLTVSILMMLAYLTMMIVTSWILSIVTIVFTSILIFTTRKIASGSRKYFMAQQKNVGALNGYIEEMIEGQKVVKVFRREQVSIEQYGVLNRNVAEAARISTQRSGMLIPITVNMGYLGFAIAAITGAFLVLNNLLTVPQLVVYLLFTRQFTGPINQMGQQLNFIQMALAGASRIFEVLDKEKEVDLGNATLVNVLETKEGLLETEEVTNVWAWKKDDELILLKGDVRFNNVTFSYVEDKTVLKNISLFAKPGQKIAFVGATGAGKTTITNLINRFYDVQEGEILFDGIDVKDIKKSSLRRALGIVLQDTHLFQTTVLENIRYGNLNASDEDVIAAAKLANAHDFILKLPKGYDTILTDDGSNLSQGQRQLLSIARAAISNPPVLILDEATSSIDTYTERLIAEGMDKLMEGRTVFVIAHRLSTIKNSKAIIILDNGEIIERGNHDYLIEQKGTYYQLYTGVFELE